MSKAFIYGNGGGSDELNVKFYTSESDIPAVGRENDIALVSTNAISKYILTSFPAAITAMVTPPNTVLIHSYPWSYTYNSGDTIFADAPILQTENLSIELSSCTIWETEELDYYNVDGFIWHDNPCGYFNSGWTRIGQYLSHKGYNSFSSTEEGYSTFTLNADGLSKYLKFTKTLTSSVKQSGYSCKVPISRIFGFDDYIEKHFYALVKAETADEDVVFRMGATTNQYTDGNVAVGNYESGYASITPTNEYQLVHFKLNPGQHLSKYLTLSIGITGSTSRTPNVTVKAVWVK